MALAPVSGYSMSAWGWQKDIRTQTGFHHGSPPYTQPIKHHLVEMLTQLRWVSWSCNHFPKITLETYHTHTHTPIPEVHQGTLFDVYAAIGPSHPAETEMRIESAMAVE